MNSRQMRKTRPSSEAREEGPSRKRTSALSAATLPQRASGSAALATFPSVGGSGSGMPGRYSIVPAMRLGILSDVHGDLAALDDALATFARIGVDRIVCAGDIVDYGAHPDDVVSKLRDLAIPTISGNHDRWGAAGSRRARRGPARGPADFLRALPAALDLEEAGVRVAIRHGTPRSDSKGIWPIHTPAAELAAFLDEARADVLV